MTLDEQLSISARIVSSTYSGHSHQMFGKTSFNLSPRIHLHPIKCRPSPATAPFLVAGEGHGTVHYCCSGTFACCARHNSREGTSSKCNQGRRMSIRQALERNYSLMSRIIEVQATRVQRRCVISHSIFCSCVPRCVLLRT